MANYYSHTVIQPAIQHADMTALERLILSEIFTADVGPESDYFYAEDRTNDWISVSSVDLQTALTTTASDGCRLYGHIQVAMSDDSTADDDYMDIDASAFEWVEILQDIVRRSTTVDYVTVVSAFTCSKMRPDGFGGMAMLITPERIFCKSTEEMLGDFLNEVETA